MPALREGITIGICHPNDITKPDRLDSPLLLAWAARAGTLILYQDAHNTPGLAELLAAAANMTSLCIVCRDVLAAAQADYLISKCCPLTRIELTGPCRPSILHETVEELLVEFDAEGGEDDFDPRQVNVLLFHCTRLPRLRWLRLNLGLLQPVMLTCAVQLRELDVLDIQMTLDDFDNSLSWALAQPCGQFFLWVTVVTSDVSRNAAFAQQLSRARLQMLTVTLQGEFRAAMQALWAPVQAERVILKFCGNTQGSHALTMLPCCSTLVLEFWQAWDLPSAIQISWEALTRHANRVFIRLDMLNELHVIGFEQDETSLGGLQQPWQLVVHGGRGVQGLPASQQTKQAYLLQNQAARAAGWTEDTDW